MTREEQIRAAATAYTKGRCPMVISGSRFKDKMNSINANFIAGAKWADANPCTPDKVVKIPERSREEIKELLDNWKGTIVACGDISISPWISVEERLPELDKEVIILDKGKHIDIDFLMDDGEGGYFWWKSDESICCEDDEITHWMPIPELPKEE